MSIYGKKHTLRSTRIYRYPCITAYISNDKAKVFLSNHMFIKAFFLVDQGDCKNTQSACGYWAKNGYCEKKENNKWMWKHCCIACIAGRNTFLSVIVPVVIREIKSKRGSHL